MTWKTSGLLGAALAVVVLSCGPGKDEAVRLKEGANLDDVQECLGVICETATVPLTFCSQLIFEYGRSPLLCVNAETICDRLDCVSEGRKCAVFQGEPYQVYCIKD
jgi:hypothetical protein